MKVTRMWTQNAERPMSAWDSPTLESTEPVLVVADTEATAALLDAAPRMAEEIERLTELIAIYERDRTKHLHLIEAGDKELGKMAESMGAEIERLTSGLRTERECSKRVITQRDELLEVIAPFAVHDVEDSNCGFCGRGNPAKDHGKYYPEHHMERVHDDNCPVTAARAAIAKCKPTTVKED